MIIFKSQSTIKQFLYINNIAIKHFYNISIEKD